MNYLRLSQTLGSAHFDMRAVCAKHNCTLSHRCRDLRPVGKLWAWLDYGQRDDVQTKEQHREYIPSYEVRAAARRTFERKDPLEVEQFLDAEAGGAGRGEPLIVPR